MSDDDVAALRHLATLPSDRPIRVLVTGSRDWEDADSVNSTLDRVRSWWPPHLGMIVVHGACPDGADYYANEWAIHNPSALAEPHPAKWREKGYAAGVIRNSEMVALGADICLAFMNPCVRPRCSDPQPHPSHGTHDCMIKAKAEDIPVWKVRDG